MHGHWNLKPKPRASTKVVSSHCTSYINITNFLSFSLKILEKFELSSMPSVSYLSKMALLYFHCAIAPSGPGPRHCRGFTTTLGRTPLGKLSARRRELTTYNAHKTRYSRVFQPFIPASEHLQTHGVYRAANGMDSYFSNIELRFRLSLISPKI
jgi:hypothetical protein